MSRESSAVDAAGGQAPGRQLARAPGVAHAPAARPLFRERALLAHEQADEIAEPLRVAPAWTKLLISCAALVVLGLLVASVVARVELTSTGRGILQGSGAPRALVARTEGRVVAVMVRAGDTVAADQELFRLESTSTAGTLIEADRAVALAERSLQDFRERKKPLYQRRTEQLEIQVTALERRTNSGRSSVARMARRAKQFDTLGREGLATHLDVDTAKEAISAADREALKTEQESASLRDQMAALELELLNEEAGLVERLELAKARRDGVQVALDSSVVRAPCAGVVGSVVVRVGDAVMNGGPLGRVVPRGAARSVVGYVPERDRAFLKVNGAVRVELDQLPAWEFGALSGRIVAVSSELATGPDLQSSFGDRALPSEPLYRVDVQLDEHDPNFRVLAGRLRPESLASLRFTLRERRVITVLFEPLKRWLE
jgi:multidrug resistance efflux pump